MTATESLITTKAIVVPGVGRLGEGDTVPDSVNESQRQFLVAYGHARSEADLMQEADSTEVSEEPEKPKTVPKKRPKARRRRASN